MFSTSPISMRVLGRLVVAIGLLGIASPATATGNEPRSVRTVIELFSSQGCSSSPPANELIGKLAENDELIVLSFHVPYWDYIGWKDTFADINYAKRQKQYSIQRGDRSIYTPQIVINGSSHVVGSGEEKLKIEIEKISANAYAFPLTTKIEKKGEGFLFSYRLAGGATSDALDSQIWAFWLRKRASVHIAGGENTGKTVEYRNTVSSMQKLGDLNAMVANGMYLDLPSQNRDVDRLVILAQRNSVAGPGKIVGAAQIDIDGR